MNQDKLSSLARPSRSVSARISSVLTARRVLVGLIIVGVVLRLAMIVLNPIDPASSSADDGDYYGRALRFAITGQYIDDSWLIRPPGHIFFFAFWLRIGVLLGNLKLGLLLIKLAQVGLAAAQIALGYGVARRLFRSPLAGLLFAAFLAVWFPFVEQPSLLFSELLYGTLFLAHVWFLLRFDANERWRELVLSGVFLGITALTRSPALYSLVFVAAWLLVRGLGFGEKGRRGGGEKRLQPSASSLQIPTSQIPPSHIPHSTSHIPHPNLSSFVVRLFIIAASTLAIVLPWTARNYVVYQRVIPVDTLGQVNLWLDLDDADQRNDKIEQMRKLPQADRATYAMAKAREILAADPLRPFRNVWPTFRHVWKLQFVEDYYLRESFYDRPLRPFAPLGLFGDLLWLVFTGAGLAGLVSPVREGWHNRVFIALWVGYTLFTVVIFHVEPRYLLPLWTLLALYGSGKLAQLTSDERGPTTIPAMGRFSVVARRSSVVAQISVLLVFAVLLVTYRDYPAIISRGEARERAMRSGDAAFARGDYVTAEEQYQDALRAQPNFADANVQLALTQLAQGQRQQAQTTIQNVKRRTAWLVGLVASGGGPDQVSDLNYAEATTGLDVQRWTMAWTQPQPTAAIHLGDGRDMGYIAGFSAAEGNAQGTFRWSTGQATVQMQLPNALEPGETLALRLSAPQPTKLTVRIGNNMQTIMVAAGAWRVYTLPIPQTAIGGTNLSVELNSQSFIPARVNPSNDDLRQLSVMVSDVFVR